MVKKVFLSLFFLLIMVGFSFASLVTTMNPWTQKPDYYNNAEINMSLLNDTFVNVDGDTMIGDLNMGGNNITNVTCFGLISTRMTCYCSNGIIIIGDSNLTGVYC